MKEWQFINSREEKWMSPLLFLFILLQIQHSLVSAAAQRSISLFTYQRNWFSLDWGPKQSTISATRCWTTGRQKKKISWISVKKNLPNKRQNWVYKWAHLSNCMYSQARGAMGTRNDRGCHHQAVTQTQMHLLLNG